MRTALLALILTAPAAAAPHDAALVLAVESYRNRPPALGAREGAEEFRRWLVESAAVPAERVASAFEENATRVDIARLDEDWLPPRVSTHSRVFVYFAGRAIRDPMAPLRDSLLLPWDADMVEGFGSQTWIGLRNCVNSLAVLRPAALVVVIDVAGENLALPRPLPGVALIMTTGRAPKELEPSCGAGAMTHELIRVLGEAGGPRRAGEVVAAVDAGMRSVCPGRGARLSGDASLALR